MKINKRLKIETYDKQISGDNWLIAIMGYDDDINKEVAITTDRVHASEFSGSPIEYAKIFVKSPKLLEKSIEVVQDIYNIIGDKNKIPNSVLELDKIIEQIKELKEVDED